MDFLGPPPGTGLLEGGSIDAKPDAPISSGGSVDSGSRKRSADMAEIKAALADDGDSAGGDGSNKELTEAQKLERRERNREHAKRSRLRKKFLLESLQEQIHELEDTIEGLKKAITEHLPDQAESIIKKVIGDKEKYTPLPMPSGFGPVKTLMEPDFRLSKYLLISFSMNLTICVVS